MVTPAGKYFGQDPKALTPFKIAEESEERIRAAQFESGLVGLVNILVEKDVKSVLTKLITAFREGNLEYINAVKNILGVKLQPTQQEVIIILVTDELLRLKVKNADELKERFNNIKNLSINDFKEPLLQIANDAIIDKSGKRNFINRIKSIIKKKEIDNGNTN